MGKLSQSIGAFVEELAERSFRRYEAQRLLTWQRCYPATKVIFNGSTRRKQVILLPEEGPPDYCLCLNGGRLLFLEIKSWAGIETHTERKRLHQYRQMVETTRIGGLGCYLVAWRTRDDVLDWRLHPVGQLEFFDNALVFRRSEGLAVAAADGDPFPEWWPVACGMESDGRLSA